LLAARRKILGIVIVISKEVAVYEWDLILLPKLNRWRLDASFVPRWFLDSLFILSSYLDAATSPRGWGLRCRFFHVCIYSCGNTHFFYAINGTDGFVAHMIVCREKYSVEYRTSGSSPVR
jgi:hypothetical protein